MKKNMSDKINRRSFIQKTAVAGAGMALLPGASLASPAVGTSGKPRSRLRIGIIGAGLRGQDHIDLLLNRDDCEVPAIAAWSSETKASRKPAGVPGTPSTATATSIPLTASARWRSTSASTAATGSCPSPPPPVRRGDSSGKKKLSGKLRNFVGPQI